MEKVRIGIICPSEIAYRRFMPAVGKSEGAQYVGVAHASAKEWFGEREADAAVLEGEARKARSFREQYGGKVFGSYGELLTSSEVDAIYLPLPPALHYRWAKAALEAGKHIFVEKPCTTSAADTQTLIDLARSKELAVHENYMFAFHDQIQAVREIVKSGKLGEVRLYRIAFGFPMRAKNDFRYNKALGGGALLDCGGYTLKLAGMLLGESAKVRYAQLNSLDGFQVDMYGSAALVNDEGVTAQVAFGMDNSYKCELEIWGSKGSLRTGRILTAPEGFVPTAEIRIGNEIETVTLPADDTFRKSIERFCQCVRDGETREANYRELLKQARIVDAVKGELRTESGRKGEQQ